MALLSLCQLLCKRVGLAFDVVKSNDETRMSLGDEPEQLLTKTNESQKFVLWWIARVYVNVFFR